MVYDWQKSVEPGLRVVVSACNDPLIVNLAISKEPDGVYPDTQKLISDPVVREDLSLTLIKFQSEVYVKTAAQYGTEEVVGGCPDEPQVLSETQFAYSNTAGVHF